MAGRLTCSFTTFLFMADILVVCMGISNAQLTINYYTNTCPRRFDTVQSVVQSAINKETRMAATLLRLFFHDCIVNGCDGSILLDDTPNLTGEKTAAPNINIAKGFEVIDQIKTAVEQVCPGAVSCADIVAIAARDSVVALGGPAWDVKLGRKDARTTSIFDAERDIPSPFSNLSTLILNFQSHGLTSSDLVVLSGAHTIGQGSCISFRSRLYNDSNIEASFAETMRSICLSSNGSGDNNIAPLDPQTPTTFDNTYYKNLLNQKGLLRSDQQLLSGDSTKNLVKMYSNNQMLFYSDFIRAMNKMGDIKPLTGSNGEIRRICRMIN